MDLLLSKVLPGPLPHSLFYIYFIVDNLSQTIPNIPFKSDKSAPSSLCLTPTDKDKNLIFKKMTWVLVLKTPILKDKGLDMVYKEDN